ncbi:MAG: hypothetical protein HY220_02385 [Candidatus Sungbacteria bacterium]|uniref:Homing endonuclease LAGLIDADG domain-containing protein n=1 Tax=Candidatus Sungiibacteriota bacterium TaxID=2750080 RepID=A0A9D6LT20_9BACT|nr:hypothetical protein [Candidatus Sungbacteria bacterium]
MTEIGVTRETLSLDFVAGLVVGEGTFYWTMAGDGYKRPVFCLKMPIRDYNLVMDVRDSLGLTSEKVYEYHHGGRHYAMLIVRNIGSLKNIVIPLLWPKLSGYKKRQFQWWFKQFKSSATNPSYRFFHDAFRLKFPDLY